MRYSPRLEGKGARRCGGHSKARRCDNEGEVCKDGRQYTILERTHCKFAVLVPISCLVPRFQSGNKLYIRIRVSVSDRSLIGILLLSPQYPGLARAPNQRTSTANCQPIHQPQNMAIPDLMQGSIACHTPALRFRLSPGQPCFLTISPTYLPKVYLPKV